MLTVQNYCFDRMGEKRDKINSSPNFFLCINSLTFKLSTLTLWFVFTIIYWIHQLAIIIQYIFIHIFPWLIVARKILKGKLIQHKYYKEPFFVHVLGDKIDCSFWMHFPQDDTTKNHNVSSSLSHIYDHEHLQVLSCFNLPYKKVPIVKLQ